MLESFRPQPSVYQEISKIMHEVMTAEERAGAKAVTDFFAKKRLAQFAPHLGILDERGLPSDEILRYYGGAYDFLERFDVPEDRSDVISYAGQSIGYATLHTEYIKRRRGPELSALHGHIFSMRETISLSVLAMQRTAAVAAPSIEEMVASQRRLAEASEVAIEAIANEAIG